MDKFEEYFRATKHYENMLLEIARSQLSVSVFDKNGRKYRNHIVQTAYEVFQHQQAKVEDLQKQLIDQGQRFNEQAQRVKDLEHKVKCEREISLFADKLCCELKKRIDAVEQVINKIRNGNYASDSGKYVAIFIGQMLEQALKGEGCQ